MNLYFDCLKCQNTITFSIKDIEKKESFICSKCYDNYAFNEQFKEKILRFSNLLYALQDTKDILGDSEISINTEDYSEVIPYDILLTRFDSRLKIEIEGNTIFLNFRTQPIENKFIEQ